MAQCAMHPRGSAEASSAARLDAAVREGDDPPREGPCAEGGQGEVGGGGVEGGRVKSEEPQLSDLPEQWIQVSLSR